MTWNRPKAAVSFKLLAVSFYVKALHKRAISYQLLAGSLLLSGCGVYSFNGTNIDPAVKTFSIQTFQNNAPSAPASLSQRFTEDIKDYYQRNTTLKLVPRDGDLQLEGNIAAYDFSPASIQQSDNGIPGAGVNRLVIQVQLRFTNTKDVKQDFEQTFQSQKDFPATQDLATVNNDPTNQREITRNIITDMFNKSVANW